MVWLPFTYSAPMTVVNHVPGTALAIPWLTRIAVGCAGDIAFASRLGTLYVVTLPCVSI